MLSTPPSTGNVDLDNFLRSVKTHIDDALRPADGWRLSDLSADVSEVISDKRDLIDIVTRYDDINALKASVDLILADYAEAIADSKAIGSQYQDHAEVFSHTMEWWNQNRKIIEDAAQAMASTLQASEYADAAASSATQTADDRRQTGEDRQAAAQSANEAATSEDMSLDAAAAAIAAAWSFDGFTPAQVSEAALRAEAAAVRAEASGGGIIVVSSEEEAAALPIGTVYVIAEVSSDGPTPVTIVGAVGENITTDTFTPTIPNAAPGDTIIIAANTKAVGGSTLTAPAGFTTLVDGYWAGTQRSWVFSGPWSNDLSVTASQPLEFAYAAVAVRGATSVTAGAIKDRGTEPAESTTVTAPAVEHGPNDLAIGIAFERTTAVETAEQVTVNAGWAIEHYTAQGENVQTTLIGVGGTGDMVATYPNPQATNGTGVQVVAHA